MLHFETPPCNRRSFIQGVGLLGLTTTAPAPLLAAAAKKMERTLSLYHIHTGEKKRITYWQDGAYLPEGILEASWFLRDFRKGEMKVIDKYLLDQLTVLKHLTENTAGFEVISGYRSPETNDHLFATTDGVSEDSLHMQGRAIDIRPYGCSLENLHTAAMQLRAGGVGYYPESNFLHLDSGRTQHWQHG